MKRELTAGAVLLLALGLVAGVLRILDLLGAETLRVLALVLAVPAGVAVMALGFTPLVRAWRLPLTPPPERHIIRETRQHTIDRQRNAEPLLPAMDPAQLYPALQSPDWSGQELRRLPQPGPEWRAGLLNAGRGPGTVTEHYVDLEPVEGDIDADDWSAWRR
jgi:hypothetical protein